MQRSNNWQQKGWVWHTAPPQTCALLLVSYWVLPFALDDDITSGNAGALRCALRASASMAHQLILGVVYSTRYGLRAD